MKQQINLFQPTSNKFSLKKNRKRLTTNRLLFGMMALTCLVLMVIYDSAHQEMLTLREEFQRAAAQNRTVEKHLAELRRSQLSKNTKSTKGDELETEMSQLSARVEANAQLIQILQEQSQGNTSGFSKYLEALARQYVENIWLTQINLRSGGTAITLTGKTLQPDLIPRFIAVLTKKTAFQQIDFRQVKLERTDGAQTQPLTFVLDTGTKSTLKTAK